MSATTQQVIGEAVQLAAEAHAGQVDRDGKPHIVHVAAVAEAVPDHCKAVAWLHDVVEDTHIRQDEIDAHFGHLIGGAVELLTKGEGESYDEYLERLIKCKLKGGSWKAALRVKQADLDHNLKRSLASKDAGAVAQYAAAWFHVTMAIKEDETSG